MPKNEIDNVCRRSERATVPKCEIIRRLGTSATQFYRLMDQTNYRKSVDQLVSLLQILYCDVDLVVRAKTAWRCSGLTGARSAPKRARKRARDGRRSALSEPRPANGTGGNVSPCLPAVSSGGRREATRSASHHPALYLWFSSTRPRRVVAGCPAPGDVRGGLEKCLQPCGRLFGRARPASAIKILRDFIVKTPSCRSRCRAFRGVGSIAAIAHPAENVNTAPSTIGAPRIAGRELETGTTW